MFLSKKIFVGLTAASLMIALPACKNSNKDVSSASGENVMSDVKMENANSLLSFVPENSPFVMASTRNIDSDKPISKLMRDKAEKTLTAYEKFMERMTQPEMTESELKQILATADPVDRIYQLGQYVMYVPDEQTTKEINNYINVIKKFKELAKDYKTRAADYGLDPTYNDSILYLDQTHLTAKLALVDGAKFKSKFDELLKNLPLVSQINSQEMKAGDQTWTVISFMPSREMENKLTKRKYDKLVKSIDPEAAKTYKAAKEKGAEPDGEQEYNLLKAEFAESLNNDLNYEEIQGGISNVKNDFPYNLRLAVHFDKNMVTAVLLNDGSDLTECSRALNPAANPIKGDQFGAVPQNSMVLGFLDIIKASDLLKDENLKKALLDIDRSFKFNEFCADEFKDVFADYPKLSFNVHVNDNNKIAMDSVLVFKDKEALAKIKTLHTPALDLYTDKTEFGIKLNIKLSSLIDQLIDPLYTFSNKDYQCKILYKLNKVSGDVLDEITDPEFKETRKFVTPIHGGSLACDKFNIKEDVFNCAFHITGPEFANVSSTILEKMNDILEDVFGYDIANKFEDMMPSSKAVSFEEDDIKVNAMLTQNDFIAAHAPYDVQSALSKDRTDQHRFFDLVISYKNRSELFKDNRLIEYDGTSSNTNGKLYVKELAEIYKDTKHTISIGTNDDGIVSSIGLDFSGSSK